MAGVVLLAGFVAVELRSDHPMIDLGLFRRPAFAAVTLAAVANGAGVIALLSYLSGLPGGRVRPVRLERGLADADLVGPQRGHRPRGPTAPGAAGPAAHGWPRR